MLVAFLMTKTMVVVSRGSTLLSSLLLAAFLGEHDALNVAHNRPYMPQGGWHPEMMKGQHGEHVATMAKGSWPEGDDDYVDDPMDIDEPSPTVEEDWEYDSDGDVIMRDAFDPIEPPPPAMVPPPPGPPPPPPLLKVEKIAVDVRVPHFGNYRTPLPETKEYALSSVKSKDLPREIDGYYRQVFSLKKKPPLANKLEAKVVTTGKKANFLEGVRQKEVLFALREMRKALEAPKAPLDQIMAAILSLDQRLMKVDVIKQLLPSDKQDDCAKHQKSGLPLENLEEPSQMMAAVCSSPQLVVSIKALAWINGFQDEYTFSKDKLDKCDWALNGILKAQGLVDLLGAALSVFRLGERILAPKTPPRMTMVDLRALTASADSYATQPMAKQRFSVFDFIMRVALQNDEAGLIPSLAQELRPFDGITTLDCRVAAHEAIQFAAAAASLKAELEANLGVAKGSDQAEFYNSNFAAGVNTFKAIYEQWRQHIKEIKREAKRIEPTIGKVQAYLGHQPSLCQDKDIVKDYCPEGRMSTVELFSKLALLASKMSDSLKRIATIKAWEDNGGKEPEMKKLVIKGRSSQKSVKA